MKVADLFGELGLKVDRKSWDMGSKAIANVRSGLHSMATAALSAAKWVAVGLGGAAAASVPLSDEYTELENRIKQVSSSTDEMNELMDRTRTIANDTRSDWKSTGEAFVRLKNSTKDLNLTTDEQLRLVMTLNMALQSSGASASEASAGTLQLMQGLASGALQGDEFRSIAEQLPDLMEVFSKELGVSRGELKKLSAEGKITSKVVVSALQHAGDSIREKFAASTATAAQGWVVFKNNIVLASSAFLRSTGVMELLGSAVQRVTDWVEANRQRISDFGASVGQAFRTAAAAVGQAVSAIMATIDWFRGGSDEAQAILVAIASLIITAVVPALYAMAAGWVAAAAPIIVIIASLAAVAYGVIKLVKHWGDIKAAGVRAWESVKAKAVEFVDRLRVIGGRLVASFASAFDAVKSFAVRLGQAIIAPFITAYDFVKSIIVGIVNFFIGRINWMIAKINWLSKKASNLPGISLGTIDKISLIGEAAAAPSRAASTTGSTITNTVTSRININGVTDPKATGAEVERRMRSFWDSQMRLNDGGE